jgi:hypothetical protein
MSVTLTYLSTVLSLPTPDFPEDPGSALRQARMRAMGGSVKSVTFSSGTVDDPIYHFTDMTEAEYNSLVSFINTTVIGATYAFTFTDWEAVTTTVKYMGGLPGRQIEFDRWVVDLALSVVPT